MKCFNRSKNKGRSSHFLLFCIFLIIATNCVHIRAYSNGAPLYDSVCTSLTPGHSSPPQTGSSPYKIELDKTQVLPNEKIKVSLLSTAESGPFKGFLAIGRLSVEETEPKGRFLGEIKSGGGPDLGKVGDCLSKPGSAMTHTSSVDKNEVHLEWEAPPFNGKYVIVVTIVSKEATYWIKIPSEVITVSGGDSTEPAFTGTTVEPATEPPTPGIGDVEGFYAGCGDINADTPKGCFGVPSNCIGSKNCEMLVTFRATEDSVMFELAGKVENGEKSADYVAVGLSRDNVMSEDSVFGCRMDGTSIALDEYYNPDAKKPNVGINRTPSLFQSKAGSYIDGYIACSFTLNQKYELKDYDQTYDLLNDEYYLLLARGTLSTKDFLGQHPSATDREVSGPSVQLTSVEIVGGKSKILIQLHGSFMIIGWLLCASTGMFTARFYKQTHVNFKPFGMAFWFQLHRTCMTLCVGFTVAAFIFIFVENKALNLGNNREEKTHPILGIILTGLALCQVGIALFRPHPGTKHRPKFNWAHWTIGTVAHIVGMACIQTSSNLAKANIQSKKERFLAVTNSFILFHIILHIATGVLTFKGYKRMGVEKPKRALNLGPMNPSGLSTEAPWKDIRTIILSVYVGGAVIAASTLIFFVVDALKD